MNDLYQDIYYEAHNRCFTESNSDAWTWEKRYAELIVRECLEQVSDFLDKQRIIKHFGLENE